MNHDKVKWIAAKWNEKTMNEWEELIGNLYSAFDVFDGCFYDNSIWANIKLFFIPFTLGLCSGVNVIYLLTHE